MMISAKSRYALRVMVDLAQHNSGEFIPVKEIATRQGISLKYLESIMTILTKGKMLESASGFWKERKIPFLARSFTGISVMSSPSKKICPDVMAYFGCPVMA